MENEDAKFSLKNGHKVRIRKRSETCENVPSPWKTKNFWQHQNTVLSLAAVQRRLAEHEPRGVADSPETWALRRTANQDGARARYKSRDVNKDGVIWEAAATRPRVLSNWMFLSRRPRPDQRLTEGEKPLGSEWRNILSITSHSEVC